MDILLRDAFARTLDRGSYGGGNPTVAELTAWAYSWRRNPSNSTGRSRRFDAKAALQGARADAAAGTIRHVSASSRQRRQWRKEAHAAAPFAPVYFESEKDARASGFRFVGYTDDMTDCRSSGYYADEHGDSVYRGAVFQLAAHKGRERFVAGYEESNTGGFLIDVRGRSAVYWETTPSDGYESNPADMRAAIDAAYSADSMAERAAERQRECSEAWQAGAEYADLGETIATTRREILATLGERKGVKGAGATLCALLRRNVSAMLDTIREARERRKSLVDGDGWASYSADCQAAFNDAAGEMAV